MNVKSEQYTCESCPAGQYVARPCNATHRTLCKQCQPGVTFQDTESHNETCQRCSKCKRREIVKEKCTIWADTICTCPDGYIYSVKNPCMKCPKGMTTQNNLCVPKVPPDRGDHNNNNGNNNNNAKVILVSAIAGIVVIFIILVIFFVCWYRRRKQRARRHMLTRQPDVLPHVEVQQPKKVLQYIPNRRGGNDYCLAPSNQRPMIQGKINSKNLSMDLINDLKILLDEKYVELAQELNYKQQTIARIAKNNEPVETLLFDYTSGHNPTKNELYTALQRIRAYEAADRVLQLL